MFDLGCWRGGISFVGVEVKRGKKGEWEVCFYCFVLC